MHRTTICRTVNLCPLIVPCAFCQDAESQRQNEVRNRGAHICHLSEWFVVNEVLAVFCTGEETISAARLLWVNAVSTCGTGCSLYILYTSAENLVSQDHVFGCSDLHGEDILMSNLWQPKSCDEICLQKQKTLLRHRGILAA